MFLLFLSCGKKEEFGSNAPAINGEWYREVVFYQIYPRSFMDSDGDGIGDLKGITSRLDYLEDLGIGGIWLNPVYPSPLVDLGYDVSDYKNIHPDLGTMIDFENLLKEAHKRNIKIFIDGVFNHTSEEHEWFKESRGRKDNPKRNWYIWAPVPYFDCRDILTIPGTFPPERWTYDALTGEYYFHRFYSGMPDLNYKNPEVQEAILDVIRFWLEKGVDGFRLDVADSYVEDEGKSLCMHQEGTHQFLKRMREVFDEYEGRAMIGEVWGFPSEINKYLGNGKDELHMIFNFILTFALYSSVLFGGKDFVEEVLEETYLSFPEGGWQGIVVGNHDLPRSYSIMGENEEKSKTLAFLQMTLPGTPFIYYGEEVGIKNGREIVVDWRDSARTPMHWNDEENGGFTRGKPWIGMSDNFREKNVEKEKRDKDSLYNFYRKLIRMRNAVPEMRKAGFIPVETGDGNVYAYFRGEGRDWVLILINLSFNAREIKIDLRTTPWRDLRGALHDIWNNEELPPVKEENSSSYRIYLPANYRGIITTGG